MAAEEERYNEAAMLSLLDRSLQPEALTERCLVQQYRTTEEQQTALYNHLEGKDRNALPIEWVIDIADEANGWFYGTAYHYDDSLGTLHVMVPDKINPTFDGNVQLDHRTIHLIECVDGNTDALFNQIVRESTERCKWDVEWFEEGAGDEKLLEGVEGEGTENVYGRWNATIAKYYFRITNQLLVEDFPEDDPSQVGFVLLTADLNVKFKYCYKERGIEDFNRLICENTVQSLDETREYALASYEAQGQEREQVQTEVDAQYYDQNYYDQQAQDQVQAGYPPEDEEYNDAYNEHIHDDAGAAASPESHASVYEHRHERIHRVGSSEMTQLGDDELHSRSSRKEHQRHDRKDDNRNDRVPPVRKMAEMSKQLKECLTEILEEREKKEKIKHNFMNNFMKFALDGDLDAGKLNWKFNVCIYTYIYIV